MNLENITLKQLVICSLAATIILGAITVIQVYSNWSLQSESADVLNHRLTNDIFLVDHFDCKELKEWQQAFIANAPDAADNFSMILQQAVQKNIRDKFC